MRIAPGIGLAALFAFQAAASAQQFTVEPLKEAAPEAIAAPIRDLLEPQGYRVLADGKPHLDVWFRKAIPASARPAGAKGSVLYPVLAEGELIGAARYAAEGQDFRDQVIAPGVYTLRYGLRLDDGNHANVAMLETPDGHGRIELFEYIHPEAIDSEPTRPNDIGMHRVAFSVDDIDAALEIAARHGCHPLRGVATYEDIYKLTYVRGPSGIIVMFAEELKKS